MFEIQFLTDSTEAGNNQNYFTRLNIKRCFVRYILGKNDLGNYVNIVLMVTKLCFLTPQDKRNTNWTFMEKSKSNETEQALSYIMEYLHVKTHGMQPK